MRKSWRHKARIDSKLTASIFQIRPCRAIHFAPREVCNEMVVLVYSNMMGPAASAALPFGDSAEGVCARPILAEETSYAGVADELVASGWHRITSRKWIILAVALIAKIIARYGWRKTARQFETVRQ